MAIGDTFATKGHVFELQSSIKLHKPSFEPKSSRFKKEEQNQKNKHRTGLLSARKLAEALGLVIVDSDNDRIIYLEIFPIQTKSSFQSDGLLSSHGQRCSRDVKVQHGSNSFACL